MKATKRRNVKSAAADAHERSKDYLDPPEMERLLEGLRMGGTALATTPCSSSCTGTPCASLRP